MKVALMVSGNLGYISLKHFIESNIAVDCVLTDRKSLSIIAFAEKNNVDCFQGNPRDGKALEFIGNHPIDVLFSVNYLFLVQEDILKWPKVIAINFHGSLLPRYRGRAPHVWAIINGEKTCGVTGNVMVKECYAGDIVIQKQIEISENMTGGDVLEKFNMIYPEMLKEVYLSILNNKLSRIPQNESNASYFEKRTPEDGVIDWSWDYQRIKNWIRAQAYPYPGAFTFCKGEKIVIDAVEFVSFDCANNTPNGSILAIAPNLIVKVADGAIKLNSTRKNNVDFKIGDVLAPFKSEIKEIPSLLLYRKASAADEHLYFEWVNDADVRKRSFSQEVVSKEQHHKWFQEMLKRKDALLLVFTIENNVPVGQVRINEKGGENILSISIDANYRGKGFGNHMVKVATTEYCSDFSNNVVVAYVKKDNRASVKIFENAGFKLFENNKNDAFFKFTFTPEK